MATEADSTTSPSPADEGPGQRDPVAMALNELLMCRFCMCYYDLAECVPRLLPCRHTICDFCLGKQLRETRSIVCVTCDVKTTMKHGKNSYDAPIDRTMATLVRFLTSESDLQGDLGRVDVINLLHELRDTTKRFYEADSYSDESDVEEDELQLNQPVAGNNGAEAASRNQLDCHQPGGFRLAKGAVPEPVWSPASPELEPATDGPALLAAAIAANHGKTSDAPWMLLSDRSDEEPSASEGAPAGQDRRKKKKRNKRRGCKKNATGGGPAGPREPRPVTVNPYVESFADVVNQMTRGVRKSRCVICQKELAESSAYIDSYMDAKTVLKLACGHHYHHHCVVKMISCREKGEKSFKCPQCKQEFNYLVPEQRDANFRSAPDEEPEPVRRPGQPVPRPARVPHAGNVPRPNGHSQGIPCWGCDYVCLDHVQSRGGQRDH